MYGFRVKKGAEEGVVVSSPSFELGSDGRVIVLWDNRHFTSEKPRELRAVPVTEKAEVVDIGSRNGVH